MGWRHYSDLIVIGLIGVVGTFTVLYAEEFVFHHNAWCIAADSHCVREWIGALSGYFAFAAAAITAFFIYGQVAEARRQTEFALGESLPQAALFDPREVPFEEAFANRLQIVNWNRNPILIREISVGDEEPIQLYRVSVVDFDGGRRNTLQRELERGRMYVPGWINRSGAPTYAEFDLSFIVERAKVDDPARIANDLVRGRIEVLIKIGLTGQSSRDVIIRAERSDALAIVEDRG